MPPHDRRYHERRRPANAHISRRVIIGARIVLSILLLSWAASIGALVGLPELVDLVRRILP